MDRALDYSTLNSLAGRKNRESCCLFGCNFALGTLYLTLQRTLYACNPVLLFSTAIRVYRKMGDVAMVQSLESIEVKQ